MSNTLLMLCIPFAGLLLCIAVMPLVKPEWWEKHQAHAVILWSLLFAIPFALFYGAPKAVETVLECLIGDYLTFIVLLFGLFCVAGNIKLEGSLVGNPKVNVIMLAVGTLFSSCIGTTGASMLFVRPIIQMNSWRKNKRHIMVFFIFLVSNISVSKACRELRYLLYYVVVSDHDIMPCIVIRYCSCHVAYQGKLASDS